MTQKTDAQEVPPRHGQRPSPNTSLTSVIQVIHAGVIAYALLVLAGMINGVSANAGVIIPTVAKLEWPDFLIRLWMWGTVMLFLIQDIGGATKAASVFPYRAHWRFTWEIVIAGAQVSTLALVGTGRFTFVAAFGVTLLLNAVWWWAIWLEYLDCNLNKRFVWSKWIEASGGFLFLVIWGGGALYTGSNGLNPALAAFFFGAYLSWSFAYEMILRQQFHDEPDLDISVSLIPVFGSQRTQTSEAAKQPRDDAPESGVKGGDSESE